MTLSRTALAASCAVIAMVGCAPAPAHPVQGPVALTSARVPGPHQETEAERELSAGEVSQALATTTHVEAVSPRDPWVHYDRAVALEESGRRLEAAAEYREAETRFTGRSAWGKAISLYGRAHALATAGKCAEAKPAYEQYAAYVRRIDPPQAELALRYAADCAAPSAPANGRGWAEYNRGVELAALGRTDEAVEAFSKAERTFGTGPERAIAVYGRARALDNARRCIEADDAYDDYAALVLASDPHDAVMALVYARRCHDRPVRTAARP